MSEKEVNQNWHSASHLKVLNVTIHRAQKARLAELSKRCGRSQSNLVREALTVLFNAYGEPKSQKELEP